jgi:hypothetical protein
MKRREGKRSALNNERRIEGGRFNRQKGVHLGTAAARGLQAASVSEPKWTTDWTVDFRMVKRRERRAPTLWYSEVVSKCALEKEPPANIQWTTKRPGNRLAYLTDNRATIELATKCKTTRRNSPAVKTSGFNRLGYASSLSWW